jgi:plastocyanin
MARRIAALSAACIVLGLSCTEDGGPSPPGPPASLAATAGNNQVGEAGQALPESQVVRVRDAAGNPLSGVTVAWEVTSGGGGVSPATISTEANGLARTERTLGSGAGVQTARATRSGLTPVVFDAVAQIQGAVYMGSRTIGPLTDTVLGTMTEFEQPLNVLVTDHLGVPVRHVVVSWTASGGGSIAAGTSVTNAGGEAMIEYTFGAEARGGYGAVAAVPGLIGSPVTWDLSALPGHPVALEKTGGDALVAQAGGQVVHTVTARDGHGNGARGVTIEWAAATGGGSIFPAQNVSSTGGRAEATRTLGPGTGEQTATATAPDLPASPTVTFTTTAAATAVRVANNAFVPAAVTLQAGDSVAWQWQSMTDQHNITFAMVAGAPADEPDRASGVVWRTFTTVGAFNYQCTRHSGMTGSVTVEP